MHTANQSRADWLDQTQAFRNADHQKDLLRLYRNRSEKHPDGAETWFFQGMDEWEQGDLHRAERSLAQAIACDGDNPKYYNAFAVFLMDTGRSQEAESILAKALTISSQSADLHCNMGRALMLQGRFDEAMHSYEKALAIDSNHAVTLANMAVIHQSTRHLPSAIACYRRALRIDPRRPDWWSNLGAALLSQARYTPAESCFRTALMLAPDHPTAMKGLGMIHCAQGQYETAAQVLENYLKSCPQDAEANATLAIVYQQSGDWQGYERVLPVLDQQTSDFLHRNQVPAEQPLFNISRSDDPWLNLAVARAWSNAIARRARRGTNPFPSIRRRQATDQRIAIGYLSADFRNHAVAHQLVSLFALHDRNRFRIYGFSVGPDSDDDYRRRISSSCDHFQDLADLDGGGAAQAINSHQIDLLIDLMGHTQQNRQDICALRPAPVQISYLGFLASSGADYMDYIIGDPIVTPHEQEACYTEKLIRLPHCYQIISPAPTATRSFSRHEVDLPADAFVFCCFNQIYKIEPSIFELWMNILKQVPASVLWLYRSSERVAGRLRTEARGRGVSPDRLIFAGKMPLGDHLARLRLADLALDTPRYNGGATTANALSAGVPVITILGRHFVSRMSASHLLTLRLENLIASNLASYEQLAVELARSPEKLAEVKQNLIFGLQNSPLMNVEGFVRNLERAYTIAWQRHRTGQRPEMIDLTQSVWPPSRQGEDRPCR